MDVSDGQVAVHLSSAGGTAMGTARHGALAGVMRYEFAMQLRRPALWVAFGLLAALSYVGNYSSVIEHHNLAPMSRPDSVVFYTNATKALLGIGVGLLLADRLRRDRSTRADELLRTTGAATSARLLGKYAGSVGATLVPVFAIYALGVVYAAVRWGDASILPLGLATFAAMIVPATLFVGAFALACTTVLWTPLFQFLFVGYWFWTSTELNGIPTLARTYLSPQEPFVVTGFFHFGTYPNIVIGAPGAGVGQAALNIVILLAAGAVALAAASWYQTWRAGRE